jgi:hypothetical protein
MDDNLEAEDKKRRIEVYGIEEKIV